MINMLQSENLKYKRTFAKLVVFIAPMYVFAYSLFMNQYFFVNAMNWWSFVILPFIIAIVTALSVIIETKAGQYRTLKSKNINLKNMWTSKIIVIGYYTFISSIVIIVSFLVIKLLYNSNLIDIKNLIIGTIIIWITTLILIPICLFIAEKFGDFAAIVVTCGGIVAGVIVSVEPMWYLCPWSISSRLMCPILGLNPNGMLLEPGDPLLDSSVILIGLVVSIAGFIILSLLTSLWFAKKEAR